MKKILIACDSFKNSISAKKVGEIIKKSFLDVNPSLKIKNIPIADGGEGTVDALVGATKGKKIKVDVQGPLFEDVSSYIGISKDKKTVFIEMANASGIELIDHNKRNPMITSTVGTGQLIKKALDLKVENIIIGIGGSATNDGGAGVASVLGVKFLDKNNNILKPIPIELEKLDKVDVSNLDKRIKNVNILVACDVDNPLTGKRGSSEVYGPQKGASSEDVKKLDSILTNFKKVLGKKAMIVAEMEGAGAAGGLGFGLVVFCGAKLESGFKIIRDYLELEKHISECDLLITGEGQMDYQSVNGKAPVEISKLAMKNGKKAIAFVGSIGKEFEAVYNNGITAVYSILNSVTDLENALKMGEKNLHNCAYNVARTIFNLK